jgi:phage baseplate assembly protein W
MAQSGYKGISFPFRFNKKGGVTTSTTSKEDVSHIIESVKQIIQTAFKSRVMMPYFGCELNTIAFQNISDTNIGEITLYITEAINNWDDRVEVENVSLTTEAQDDGTEQNIVDITINVQKYLQNYNFQVPIQLGGEVS